MANPEKQLYQLAVKEAMRSVSAQQATLESVRSRAGVLLSATMISTSFFGAQSLHTRLTGFLPVIASLLFVGVGVCATAVLWPRRSLLFTRSLLHAVQAAIHPDMGKPEDAYWAARHFSEEVMAHLVATSRRLGHLFLLLSVGWVLFVLEILVWLAHTRWE
jgi:hypothetical protein